VRGAPAIAIAAALGLAVECSGKEASWTGSLDETKVRSIQPYWSMGVVTEHADCIAVIPGLSHRSSGVPQDIASNSSQSFQRL
jgi:hypothetical protein